MSDITTVGLDLAKNVFQVHGADGAGRVVLCKKLRRAQVLEFFRQLPSCFVAMEARGGTHCWGREIGKLDTETARRVKENELARRLMTVEVVHAEAFSLRGAF